MRPTARLAAAVLLLAATTGCSHAQPTAVATATGAMAALGKAGGAAMPREQATALVKVLDKNGDGQLTHDEAHMTLLWGATSYLSNSPDIFDPTKPGKPIPAAQVIDTLSTDPAAKLCFSGAVGVKDQHLVKMAKADVKRIAEGVAQVLATGPAVQRGKIPVRHVIIRHYIFRPGKDAMRMESPRWVAGTIADQMANENNAVTIEAAGRHKDGASYQFYFYEHKVF